MRPLQSFGTETESKSVSASVAADPGPRQKYESTREILRLRFHSKCIFNGNPITAGMSFVFADDGSLNAVFICGKQHQGYDGMVHGGVSAAIIDASMAQCLMGHGKVGYTTDLSIRFCKPLLIGKRARLRTTITEQRVNGLLVSLKTEIVQSRAVAIKATGRFYISDTYAS